MPRPFCKATKDDHVCVRMLGHPGAHVERHHQKGDTQPDVEWFTVIEPMKPHTIGAA